MVSPSNLPTLLEELGRLRAVSDAAFSIVHAHFWAGTLAGVSATSSNPKPWLQLQLWWTISLGNTCIPTLFLVQSPERPRGLLSFTPEALATWALPGHS